VKGLVSISICHARSRAQNSSAALPSAMTVPALAPEDMKETVSTGAASLRKGGWGVGSGGCGAAR
jgi:hypothetical protein